ncbi:universal stress protein [Emticicia sp. SJ17W-69]|uniref:universal stress protein n=1 Tax=Emticicia sp. SJ17W-69 TaxID=3421657 RepID=UPI003EBBA958
MKKILVPTDFSPIANNALDIAVDIARYNGAKIELLNVKMYPVADVGAYYSLYGASGFTIDEKTWADVLKAAKLELNKLIEKYEDVSIKPLVEETAGDFVSSVLEHKADLIVMGSNGADGLKELFSGSNSEEIVRLASCPVLVVKGSVKTFAPKKVVLTIDFSHEKFLKKAFNNLPLKDAELHFLHVDTGLKAINYKEDDDKMHKLANKIGLKNCQFEILNAATVEYGILEYTEKINADLIVMYTHGRRGISHFFNGSIAEDVVNHSDVPVFTYVEA